MQQARMRTHSSSAALPLLPPPPIPSPRLAASHVRVCQAWRGEVLRQRRATDAHADGAAARCRSAFPLEPSAFRWAFGTVLSRAFSSPRHLSLLPLIDLCNHGAGRDHPEAIAIGGSDEDVCFTVSSVSQARGPGWGGGTRRV
eukprot:357578-Chlamydomonas_euryale.AAC.4